MICDPHHHLWELPGQPIPVYLSSDWRADTATVPDVVASVYVECRSAYRAEGPELYRPVGETEFVVAQDPDGFVAGIVGFADLNSVEVDDVLAAHIEAGQGRFRGVRYITAYDPSSAIRTSYTNPPPGLLSHDDFRRGVRALGRAGLNFDAWLYHPQLPEVVELARALPDVPIIVEHMGGPLGVGPYAGRRDETLREWRTSIAQVATCPNLSLKLGGIGMHHFGIDWHIRPEGTTADEIAAVWGPEVRWCIEQLGADRCMFESNFPVDKASFSYATLWQAFDLMVADASDGERQALFHDTACRIYRL